MSGMELFFRGMKKGFGDFGHGISSIVNSALLLVVYTIGVGLTSILAKLFNKRFLFMKASRKRPTYWSDLNLKKRPMEEYYRQF